VLDYTRLIQKGQICCIDETVPSGAYEISKQFVADDMPIAYFTRKHPNNIRAQYGTNGSQIYWLTTNNAEDELCIGPNDIPKLYKSMEPLIKKGGLIVLDCMEYLTSQNSFGSILRFTQFLYDNIAGTNARVIISMDKQAFETQQFHLLNKNMKDITNELDLETKIKDPEKAEA